jgi:hypothetical protein
MFLTLHFNCGNDTYKGNEFDAVGLYMSFQNGVWTINDWTISEFWYNALSIKSKKSTRIEYAFIELIFNIVACMQNFQLVHFTLRTSCNLQNGNLKEQETKTNVLFIKNVSN